MVVGQAAMMVHQLSKKEAFRQAIINSPQMITSLIRGINTTADTETMRYIAGGLGWVGVRYCVVLVVGVV